MDHLMSKEESYADRRKLFKNIWDTSMHVDEKEDIFSKPKVIKTLRLDEMDRCLIGKKKKQRIKNLRTVCNKLLDFCDRQDADDKFYEQMVAQGKEPPLHTVELKLCKKKTIKAKKKIKNAKSMHPTINATVLSRAASSQLRDDLNNASTSISRNTSNIKINRTSIAFSSKRYFTPDGTKILATKSQKKVLKKNSNKKNKSSHLQNMGYTTGPKILYKLDNILKPTKKLLQIHKVNI